MSSSIVKLNLTHNNLSMRIPEVRFDYYQTIASIKNVCEKKFGSESYYMQLVLQDAKGVNLVTMNEDEKQLCEYSPLDNFTIHVIDTNPMSITKNLEDLSSVPKYNMSEEDYDKLPDNFRKFKKEFLKNHPELVKAPVTMDPDYMKAEAESIAIGSRCQMTDFGHRGTVSFVGRVPELAEGFFLGITLDEPFGENDGSVGAKSYFTCNSKYGIFLRPDKVDVGDYPELDFDDEI